MLQEADAVHCCVLLQNRLRVRMHEVQPIVTMHEVQPIVTMHEVQHDAVASMRSSASEDGLWNDVTHRARVREQRQGGQ